MHVSLRSPPPNPLLRVLQHMFDRNYFTEDLYYVPHAQTSHANLYKILANVCSTQVELPP